MTYTILKPFIKYNAILAISLLAYNAMYFFSLDDLVFGYMFFVYFPILLIAAPITFGICYGNHLSQNFVISLKAKFKISFTIFLLSYATYSIPFCKWLLGHSADFSLLMIFPSSALHAFVFFCSISINQLIHKHRKTHS